MQSKKFAFSNESTCNPCKGVQSKMSTRKFCSANLGTSQIFKGQAWTFESLNAPNEPASGFEAGQFAYQVARNIDSTQFQSEQSTAFTYFQERFNVPANYTLTPVIAPISGSLDYYFVTMLGLPLWRIEAYNGSTLEIVGYYRPAVYRKLNDVICFKQSKNCNTFKYAVYAEHQIFMLTDPLVARSRLCCEPGQNFALPDMVSPQYVYDLPDPNGNYAMAVYGYLSLTNDDCTEPTSEIIYRSLYQASQTLSSNFDFMSDQNTGDLDGAIYYGLLCEAASTELSNGTFNAVMTISRIRKIMGNVDITADPTNYSFQITFNSLGYTELVNNGVCYFPKATTQCILGDANPINYTYV